MKTRRTDHKPTTGRVGFRQGPPGNASASAFEPALSSAAPQTPLRTNMDRKADTGPEPAQAQKQRVQKQRR